VSLYYIYNCRACLVLYLTFSDTILYMKMLYFVAKYNSSCC